MAWFPRLTPLLIHAFWTWFNWPTNVRSLRLSIQIIGTILEEVMERMWPTTLTHELDSGNQRLLTHYSVLRMYVTCTVPTAKAVFMQPWVSNVLLRPFRWYTWLNPIIWFWQVWRSNDLVVTQDKPCKQVTLVIKTATQQSGMIYCREPAWGIPPVAKVMRKRPDRQRWDQASREPPWTFLSIYPKTRVCPLY